MNSDIGTGTGTGKQMRDAHWFFLRGLARESGHWGDLLARFEGAAPGLRASALDLPGFGTRSTERSPTSIRAIVEAARDEFERARALAPGRRAFLFAISLGGMVAAEWMAAYPRDFAGAVLTNSSFGGWSPAYRRLTPEAMGRLVGIACSGSALARERAVLAMVSNRPEIRERVAEEWARLAVARPMQSENFIRQLLAAMRFRPHREAPLTPVLILGSAGDRMVHPSCSTAIAERWRAPLQRHPSAGHDLPLDAPEWVVEKTLAWAAAQTLL